MGWTTGESRYLAGMWLSVLIGAIVGLNSTIVGNSTLGLAGTMVNGSRIVYYQNKESKIIMELNNTDFPSSSKAGYTEAWVNDPSTKGTGSRAVNVGVQVSNGFGTSTLSKAMVGSKLSVAQGFRGLTRQLYMFYQSNGSDIIWRSRNEYAIGQWTDPMSLNVGI